MGLEINEGARRGNEAIERGRRHTEILNELREIKAAIKSLIHDPDELKCEGRPEIKVTIQPPDEQDVDCWSVASGSYAAEGEPEPPNKCGECASFIQQPGGDGYCLNHQIPVAGCSRAPKCFEYWQKEDSK